MDIQFHAEPAVQLLQQYPKQVQRATVRALNRALTTGKAAVARLVATDMRLKVGVVKDAIKVRKATPSTLQITLRASLKRIPLMDFAARATKSGVTANLGGGRASYPHLFLATMLGSGHTGVFGRDPAKFMRKIGPKGGRRQAIVERFGVSIGHVFIKHQAVGIAAMREAFEKNLASELKFASTEGV